MEIQLERWFSAVVTGDLSALAALLPSAALNACDGSGKTALMLASQAGHEDLVIALIEAGANMDVVSDHSSGSEEPDFRDIPAWVATAVAEAEADPDGWFGPYDDRVDDCLDTALALAIGAGHEAVARRLILAGADLTLAVSDEFLPLGLAARYGRAATVGLLLDRLGDDEVRRLLWQATREAARYGHAPVLELLLATGADPESADYEGETALMLAAESGDLATVDLLLAAGADPNRWSQGETPLGNAAKSCQLPVYRRLLPLSDKEIQRQARRDLEFAVARKLRDHPLGEALVEAAFDGHLPLIQGLLEAGAPIDHIGREGETPLMNAVMRVDGLKCLKVLLEAGADPNVQEATGDCDAGQTAVMKVLGRLDPKQPGPKLRLLAAAGADLDLVTEEGESACLMALRRDDYAGLSLLLELGADPDLRDPEGNSVLTWAVRKRKWVDKRDVANLGKTIELLRGLGASEQGLSQVELLEAVELDDLEAAEACLLAGANPNHRLDNTPLCAAAGRGNVRMAELLLHHGADIDHRSEDSFLADTPKSEQDWNPLLTAASDGHLEMVRFLVEQGADLEVGFRRMGSALDMARESAGSGYPRPGDPQAVVSYLESLGMLSYVSRYRKPADD